MATSSRFGSRAWVRPGKRVWATPAPAPVDATAQPDAKPVARRVNRAPARIPYTRGLHEVADRVWAWTLPDGGYGWSNAGLVAGDGASLLVDTLFDLALTREMLTAMRRYHLVGTHHRRADHPLQRGPHPRQPTARRLGADHRRAGHRRRDRARHGTRDAGDGADREPRPGRYPLHARPIRALRLQRHHGAQRRSDVRARPDHRRRRTVRRPAEPGSRAHRSGFGGARARRGRAVRRRPAVHRLHPDRVGRPDRQLDRRVRRDDRARCADRGARPRPRQRSGRNPCGPWVSRPCLRAGRGRLPPGLSLVRGGRHHRPRGVCDLAGCRSASSSTSTSVTANSTPRPRSWRSWPYW